MEMESHNDIKRGLSLFHIKQLVLKNNLSIKNICIPHCLANT
jgi:hypothetical protein